MQTKSGITESGANGQGALATNESTGSNAVSREVHGFLADVEDLITATTSLTGEDLARAKARLSARVTAAKESVAKVGGEIADRTRDAAKATDGYVRNQPWQAVGIGAALGMLIGFVLARR